MNFISHNYVFFLAIGVMKIFTQLGKSRNYFFIFIPLLKQASM